MDSRLITPDAKILAEIFPSLQPTSTEIFVQTWDRCIFVARFDDSSSDRIVRLEDPNDRFHVIAALEKLASLALPELVPTGYQIGTITNTSGRTFDFSVTEFVQGFTLKDVWTNLNEEDQDALMQSIINAVQKLQTIRLDDKAVQEILKDTPYLNKVDPNILGGPHLGYLREGSALLEAILQYRKIKPPFCSISMSSSGIVTLQSVHEELGSKQVVKTEHLSWENEAVFCHNDLHPCNIIVRKSDSPNESQEYRLAAIIDWEMAGFFPFAYELSLQDTVLGTGNMSYSWHKLFLKHAQKKLSFFDTPSQASLLQAMTLIFESQQKSLPRNISATIRRKWIEREKVVRAPCVFDGWVRRPDAGDLPRFSAEDDQKLEDDVLRERGLI